jgi:hypothetical protein
MRQNNILYIIALLALMLTSCIKSYEPVIESKDANKFVVSGQVAKGDSVQYINVSMTSPIGKPEYIPVIGCTVTVIDDKNNNYTAIDLLDGNYACFIPESALTAGSSFKVEIITSDGVNLVSDFDQIYPGPDIDSVYYHVEEIATNNPEFFINGIQFYVDLNAESSDSHYFRWEAIETWEYHSTWPREWYYDGQIHHIWPPDYSRSVCWRTNTVKNVFTLTTQNLSENKYRLFPLQYVDNHNSARLVYGYSLLIRQYALSNAAFVYWDKLRINSNTQGGLYDKQPLAVRGNLRNVTHPDEIVLGFFGASTVASRRIFVSNVPGLPITYDPACNPSPPLRKGAKDIDPRDYPAYLYGDYEGFSWRLLDTECVDCLTVGGTNVKPAFWPY